MFKTSISGINLETCVYNASGARCTESEELFELEKSKAGAVLTKSCTLNEREGNQKPRYFGFDGFSINSMGIPNHGFEYYANLKITKKPYFLSVSGLSVDENLQLLGYVKERPNVSAVELNVSCPNIIGKPQLGYDIKGLDEFLDKVQKIWEDNEKPLGLKLPPYFDISHFESVAQVIRLHPCIRFLTCSNSFGNGLWIDSDSESVVIKPKNGFGGVGGKAMKATTLANVHKFYQLLGDSVDIIGCGGVTSGKDIFELILCGAKCVQIGTQFMEYGTIVFSKYLRELKTIMELKGYTTIENFRGKLKYL